MVLSFRKCLYWSLGLHFSFFVLLLISPYLPFTPFRLHQDKIVWVTLPRGTTNDWGSPLKKATGLPKTTIEEQKRALPSPPNGWKKTLMTYTRTKPAQRKTEVRDARMADALTRIQQQVAQQKQVAMKPTQPEAAQIPETRPGGFTSGTKTGAYVPQDDPEYVMYQAKIRQRIMNEWILPLKFTEQPLGQEIGLICKINVHMNKRGEVVQTEWDQKSGNPSFDMSAMRAIEKASPLDIPPERLKYEVFTEGFIVEFNPQAKQQ